VKKIVILHQGDEGFIEMVRALFPECEIEVRWDRTKGLEHETASCEGDAGADLKKSLLPCKRPLESPVFTMGSFSTDFVQF